MNLTLRQRIGNGLAAFRQKTQAPSSKEVYAYSPQYDRPDGKITDDLTFSQLASHLAEGDSGDAATMLKLWSEMLGKDIRLRSVVNTRIAALTGLEWEIVAGSKEANLEEKANAAADYVRETLGSLRDDTGKAVFPRALRKMAKAIPTNLGVLEIDWKGTVPVNLRPVSDTRLTIDYQQSPDVRIITDTSPMGIELPPNKFIVHIPDDTDVNPFAETTARAIATLWLAKKLCFYDWNRFAELFGLPLRVGTYPEGTSETDKAAILAALENMGSCGYGIKREGIEFVFQQAQSRSEEPFSRIMEYIDRQISIGLLGGNLVADTTGGTGTFATIRIQNVVRRDLLINDIEAEARTLEEQLFRPMIALKFPGRNVPVPKWTRILSDPVDQNTTATALVTMTRDLGLKVTNRAAYDLLNVPRPPEVDLDAPVTPPPLQPALPAFSESSEE